MALGGAFFKTRQLACEAINGGKVHLNGQRTKPGKEIKAGSQLRIHKGSLEWELEVKVAASKRRPAEEAKTFYVESEESFLRRQRLTQELREQRAVEPHPMRGKPSKRDRRMIHRFTAKGE
ncbi:RNA-binding S4 domain protein [endosymbiont of Tevnia jerichonana (vent Tica)]|uniref:RNA-binding S4 domain protein n=1 Tax=endosymbiont of Tevnia jerichonana (vent Tica) TaxID=1049564 RepID=G2FHL1_9GAMM|nr:RNA-binding S4 domain protein [endosymbiont of Tevnia jerichonana (vent Tica)]